MKLRKIGEHLRSRASVAGTTESRMIGCEFAPITVHSVQVGILGAAKCGASDAVHRRCGSGLWSFGMAALQRPAKSPGELLRTCTEVNYIEIHGYCIL